MEEQEKLKGYEEQDSQSNQDPFTNFMFGPRHDFQLRNEHERQEPDQNPSSINYEELMIAVDSIIESVQELKPLFHKAYPFIEKFLKKK
jgi:hypothetical protein